MKKQQGFTLIELVVVIVILGILSAVALPKFVDLSTQAGLAATQGVAGALASSTAVNYAAQVAGNNTGPTGLVVANAALCTTVVLTPFVTGVVFTDTAGATSDSTTFSVAAGTGDCADAPGTAVTCTLQGQYGGTATATIICGKT